MLNLEWPYDLTIPLYTQENWKHMATNICKQIFHNIIISNSQKVETTYMSINWLT